jgi:hypothetical protein
MKRDPVKLGCVTALKNDKVWQGSVEPDLNVFYQRQKLDQFFTAGSMVLPLPHVRLLE